jgi:hypothetical protein
MAFASACPKGQGICDSAWGLAKRNWPSGKAVARRDHVAASMSGTATVDGLARCLPRRTCEWCANPLVAESSPKPDRVRAAN